MKSLFKQYLTNGMVQTDTISLARMCAYFIFYDIPYPIDDKAICKSLYKHLYSYLIRALFIFNAYFLANWIMTTQRSSDISNITLYKLYKILQTIYK